MKTSISFLVFICAALVIWWSLTKNNTDNETLQPVRNQPYIEIFINGFNITALNEQGKPDYTLTGKRFERYNNSNNATITEPVFNFLQADNRWLVTAEKAILNEKRNLITLIDNVVMQQQDKPQAMSILSDKMFINTLKQTAYTRTPVEIHKGDSEMKAIGMRYTHKNSRLLLKSRVNGYFLDTPAISQ